MIRLSYGKGFNTMKNLYAKIMPFIMLGIALVAIFYGLILLAYLFVFGAIVGMGLFAIAWVKAKYFATRSISVPKKRSPRTFDHNE
jgi:hypothetical protein